MEIVVFGSINQDMTVTCERMPVVGETLTASSLTQSAGGKGANQAVAAARLGSSVTMIGRVGDDAAGEAMVENLMAQGVDASCVETSAGVATGTALICVADKDDVIIVVPGANAAVDVSLAERNADVIARADMLLLQQEVPAQANLAAARIAHDAGVPVCLNPAPARQVDADLLGLVSYLTPNEHEIVSTFGNRPVEKLLRAHVGKVVCTLGRGGSACALADGSIVHVPAMDVNVVDTTGAGDTFCAAFANALVNGRDLPGAMRFANAAAGLAVTKLGAQAGMPTSAEVSRALAKWGL